MISFLLILSWMPLLLTILIATSNIKRKRVAIPFILFIYVIVACISITISHLFPIFTNMMESGTGDPQLLAGEISEAIVTAMLRAFIDIPIVILVFFGVRKWRQNVNDIKGPRDKP